MDMKSPAPKLFVFVLMPFAKDFDDVYQLGIKAACEDLGMYCERVDETHVLGPIYDKIVTSISKADIIIADLTGRNANVYYETGYAHAISKVTIHLCQDVKEIPFDLLGFQHIVYSGRIVDLKKQLKTKLEWAKEFIRTKGEEIGTLNFDFYSAGTEIVEVLSGNLKKVYSPDGRIAKVQTEAQIDILNSGAGASQSIGPVYIYSPSIAISIHNPRDEKGEQSAIHAVSEMEGFDFRHQVVFKETFAAGEWKSLPLVFQLTGNPELLDKDSVEIPIKIRFLTESTPLDLDVNLKASVTDTTSPIEFLFAQEECPETISVIPTVEYERDGRIDEAGFQFSISIKNLSDREQKVGPLHVYTDDSVIKFDASSGGRLIMGIGGSYYEPSDEEGYTRKFVETDVNRLEPHAYESGMFGFELDGKKLRRNLSGTKIPLMIKVFTDTGPLTFKFTVTIQ